MQKTGKAPTMISLDVPDPTRFALAAYRNHPVVAVLDLKHGFRILVKKPPGFGYEWVPVTWDTEFDIADFKGDSLIFRQEGVFFSGEYPKAS